MSRTPPTQFAQKYYRVAARSEANFGEKFYDRNVTARPGGSNASMMKSTHEPYALLLALLAIADLAVIVHLRQRHGRRVQMDRGMSRLWMAGRRRTAASCSAAHDT